MKQGLVRLRFQQAVLQLFCNSLNNNFAHTSLKQFCSMNYGSTMKHLHNERQCNQDVHTEKKIMQNTK